MWLPSLGTQVGVCLSLGVFVGAFVLMDAACDFSHAGWIARSLSTQYIPEPANWFALATACGLLKHSLGTVHQIQWPPLSLFFISSFKSNSNSEYFTRLFVTMKNLSLQH